LKAKNRKWRIILNNDGGTLSGMGMEAPIGVKGLVEATVEPLVGTQIDALYWTLGTDPGNGGIPTCRFSNIFSHDTKVGQRWGVDQEKFESASNWRIYENARQLIEEGNDSPKVIIEAGHQAGKEVFISVRMNDCHDGLAPGGGQTDNDRLPPHTTLNKMKQEHPDWLLGPMEGVKFQLHRFAFDYAVPEARAFRLALIEEACEKYELDGLDLDFCRHPRFFKAGTEEANACLLTDFMVQVRSILDRTGERRNKHLPLSVRVLPNFAINRKVGIDLKTWLDKRLIDVLICGSNVGCMQRLPVEEYVAACRNTGILVLAHIGLGPSWGMRQSLFFRGMPYLRDYMPFTDAMYRAMAANYWRAGVDGIYLWNNHLIEYMYDPNWERQPWREIGDPDLIARMDKHYLLDHDMGLLPLIGEFDRRLRPPAQLPAVLSDNGTPAEIQFDIADDVESSLADKVLEGVTLRLCIPHMTAYDRLVISLNGKPLDQDTARVCVNWNL
jgi:hypothetical protein